MFSALFVAVGIVVASTILVTARKRKRPAVPEQQQVAPQPASPEPQLQDTALQAEHGTMAPGTDIPLEDAPDLGYDDMPEERTETTYEDRTADTSMGPGLSEVPLDALQDPISEGPAAEDLIIPMLETAPEEIIMPTPDSAELVDIDTPLDMDISTDPVIEVTTMETPAIEDIQASVPANSTFELVHEELAADIEIPVPDSVSTTGTEMLSAAGDDIQFVALTEQPEISLAPEAPVADDDMLPQDTPVEPEAIAPSEQTPVDTGTAPDITQESTAPEPSEALPDPGPAVIPPADPGPPPEEEEEARKVNAEVCDTVPETITIKKGVMPVSDIKNKVESLLFMAKMPLTAADLAPILKEDKKIIEGCLETIFSEYSQRALQIVRVAGGYQMATRPEYHDVIQRFVKSPVEVSLSAAAMETLAIVAYRQPISRREVEHIRGVNSDATVRSLQDKGLIQELGKGDIPGKPIVFGTTDLFLRHFGLNDIKDLPPDPGMNYQLPFRKTITAEGGATASAEIETSPST